MLMILMAITAAIATTQPAPAGAVGVVWQALQTGGSAAIALVAIGAWYFERADRKEERDANRKLQEKVIEMALAQVVATEKTEQTIRAMTKVLDQAFPRTPH